MIDEAVLEHRLATLELAVADVKQQLEGRPAAPDWIQAIAGSISDDEAFREALAYGRGIRTSDRPDDAEQTRV